MHFKYNESLTFKKVLIMKTLNLNLALIAIQILEFDADNYSANIRFGFSEANANGRPKKWYTMDLENVFATGRTIKRLKDGEIELGVTYASVNTSRDAKANPMCLKRKMRLDKDGNPSVSFYLSMVEENGNYPVPQTLPDGTISYSRVWKRDKHESQYIRYVDKYDSDLAYHIEKQKAEATA